MRQLSSALVASMAWGVAIATFAAPASGQACTAGPPTQLGTVNQLAGPCPSGVGPLARTTCTAVRVVCDGIPARVAELRIVEPAPTVSVRGTVVVGTGGGGIEFYTDSPGGTSLVQDLVSRGFRVVDRKWNESWFGDPVGVRRQSCRYATLLTWIHANVHTTGLFCATGNSGGSAEIGYALTTWGRDALLDVAVPTGGPPMARLDWLCASPGSPAWPAQCATVMPAGVMECGAPACTLGEHPVCVSCSATPTLADLHADSILHPGATLDFPTTRVHSVIGAMDCTSAVPMAVLFFDAITSEKVLEFTPATPHATFAAQPGRDAIVRALLGGGACQSGSATTAWQEWPQVGGSLDLDVRGPALAGFQVFLSLNTSLVEIPPVGWLFLGAPAFNMGGGTLDANGSGTLSILIPAIPQLAGLPLFDQALAGACLTNLTRVEILP